MARRQLTHVGITRSTIDRWLERGEIHRVHRAVDAVGHTALSTEARLTAAVLFAGPDAMLSHGTAAWHRGIPVASVSDTLADLADAPEIRYLLSQADFLGRLDLEDLRRRRNRALRAGLRNHQPARARARSEFERRLVRLCERHGIPIPELNVRIEGHRVDAVWRAQRVIVELDGRDGHASWARICADHVRDATLRAAGWVVLRYVWEQPDGVIATDITTALGRDGRTAPAAARSPQPETFEKPSATLPQLTVFHHASM